MIRCYARSAGRLLAFVSLLASFLAVLLAVQTAAALAEERLALVIGNSSYRSIPVLDNPSNDAKLIGQRLRQVGFEVETVENADLDAMRAAVRGFAERVGKAGKAAVALLYYAGHGVQDDRNRNYLIPVDAQLKSQTDLVDHAMKVEYVQELIEDARPKIWFLILDACRDNPLPATARSSARGLAAVESRGSGTLIAFSTAPGKTALDGEADGNSPYAAALAAEIVKPGSFDDTFRRTHYRVVTSTNGQQIPWKTSSVVEEFSFVPPDTPPPPAPEPPVNPAPAPIPENAPERLAKLDDPELEYQKAVLVDSIEEYERLIQRFPRHARRETVIKLIELKREDMLWRQIEQEPDANQQRRMLDRMINGFPEGAYLDRAQRKRADLIERLNPPAPVRPPPPPPPQPLPQALPQQPPPQRPLPQPQAYIPPPTYVPPAPPQNRAGGLQPMLRVLAASRWAIGQSANCAVPRRSYRLAANGSTIRWQDGTGNIDVEDVTGSAGTSFNTVTLRSVRPDGGGPAPGSRWTYDLSDPSAVRVTQHGRNAFVLVPCR